MLAMNSDPLPNVSSTYERICEDEDVENCVKPFLPVNNSRQFKDMKTHNIMMCTIPKTGSTLLYAINCLLNDELGFFYNKKKIFGDFNANDCFNNARWTMEDAAEVHGPEVYDWTKLTVVRDPIDRFLSAFVFACIKGYETPNECKYECNGCGSNFTCFVEREYDMLMRFNRGRYGASFLLQHTWPQNWWCDMSKYRHNTTIIKHDTDPNIFIPRLINFFESKNISAQALNYIKDITMNQRTHHATVSTRARQFFEDRLRSSPYLMDKVVRMFYHDFKVFGFSLPPGYQ
ncbi:unnamed protein product [Bursaphelenchus okinawaensis]|uniref:Sulfotransferase domain-containing protein n=1 Tax=Bursaphelenchus okinawaensis TaxID=465554 RepID=A0A811KD40_9BILA|nr:unnamed protein product [Bursaphelenchus okinawaensis]CAG9101321.1 unnamed protein product [Bursaphelenchus okinawaensis]